MYKINKKILDLLHQPKYSFRSIDNISESSLEAENNLGRYSFVVKYFENSRYAITLSVNQRRLSSYASEEYWCELGTLQRCNFKNRIDSWTLLNLWNAKSKVYFIHKIINLSTSKQPAIHYLAISVSHLTFMLYDHKQITEPDF